MDSQVNYSKTPYWVVALSFICGCVFSAEASEPGKATAVQGTETIVCSQPETTQEQLIDQIASSSVKGQYSCSKALLSVYKKKYQADNAYQMEYARLLALTGESQKALGIVKPLLKEDPGNKTLQQIQAYALAHPEPIQLSSADIAKLSADEAEKVQINPDLFLKAVHAYTVAQDNGNALSMLRKAQALRPNDLDIVYLQGKLLQSMGDYEGAFTIYKKLYKQDPKNAKFLLAYARMAYQTNRLDLAAKLYTDYIRAYPNDKEPLLEAAYAQAFRGSFRTAISLLNQYQKRFGESTSYLIERARILAIANYPTEALSIVGKTLPQYPDNYDLNYANTVALFYDNRPDDMFNSLSVLDKIKPNSMETINLRYFVSVPYVSRVDMDEYHSHDSQTVDIDRVVLSPKYALSPTSSILGDFYVENLSASLSSGLNPIEGGNSVTLTNYKAGFSKQFSPSIRLDALGGASHASDGRNAAVYTANMATKWTDNFLVNFLSKEDYYDVSARAVSLGVKQNLEQANFIIRPCVQCLININTSYSIFSDSNRMSYGSVNLSRNILSTQWFNLNFGLASELQGFKEQLNNGYYSPDFYQYYGANTGLYIKQSDNIGYNLSVGLGEQKDNTFERFSPANDYGVQGYFGIYRDWYLILSGGYSTRVSSAATALPSTDTNYRVYALDVKLTKRFF